MATSSIPPLTEDGYFFGGMGIVPGVPDNAVVEITLRAWMDAPTWEAAGWRGEVTWHQLTGSWNPEAFPPSPPTGPDLTNPALTFIIPEPSTIALGLMGGSAMLLVKKRRSSNRVDSCYQAWERDDPACGRALGE